MRKFENLSPTAAEQELFRYAGFYLIERTDEMLRYAVVYTDERGVFPTVVEVDDAAVDYHSALIFYLSSETVEGIGQFDGKLLGLLSERTKELGWK